MSKRVIVLAMGSFFVLVLSGCGSVKESDNQEKESKPSIRELQGTKNTEEASLEMGDKGDKKEIPDKKGTPGEPPAEMTAACEGKAEGDGCEVALREGSEKKAGTCKKMPQGEALICLSQDGPSAPRSAKKEAE